jgi:hypothetical protein
MQRISDWSSDRSRRYALGRFWGSGPLACVIGLNPSRADDQVDDPTNRRLVGLLGGLDFGGYWLVNLLPDSTPYPKMLRLCNRKLSGRNQAAIRNALDQSQTTIFGWGATGIYLPHRLKIESMTSEAYCFGITKQGEPKHPLYLPSDSQLVRFPERII